MNEFNAEYYRSRIAMLEDDISMFGAAGDDLERLASYKAELKRMEQQAQEAGE